MITGIFPGLSFESFLGTGFIFNLHLSLQDFGNAALPLQFCLPFLDGFFSVRLGSALCLQLLKLMPLLSGIYFGPGHNEFIDFRS